MFVEIYDYAAKLLNNMTTTMATISTNLDETTKRRAKTLIQATTGNMKTLLNHTITGVNPVASHLGIPALLLQTGSSLGAGTSEMPANTTNALSVMTSSSNLTGFIESSTTTASTMLSSVVTTLPTVATLPTLPATATSSMAATFQAQTVATFIAAGNKNRAPTIVVYPTVSPESIVIPIVSCIFGFPILALIVICCLRRRAKLARERDRRRNYDMQDHAVSLVRFSPIHRLNYRSSRAISLRPERSLSQGFTSLELDTVLEERCSDVEQTQTEILNAESPMDTTSYKMSFSSS